MQVLAEPMAVRASQPGVEARASPNIVPHLSYGTLMQLTMLEPGSLTRRITPTFASSRHMRLTVCLGLISNRSAKRQGEEGTARRQERVRPPLVHRRLLQVPLCVALSLRAMVANLVEVRAEAGECADDAISLLLGHRDQHSAEEGSSRSSPSQHLLGEPRPQPVEPDATARGHA